MAPSGWEMRPWLAVRPKAAEVPVVVVIPGTAACAAPSREPMAATAAAIRRVAAPRPLVVTQFIRALLEDADLGHLAAEVFGIVREVIEVGGVEEIRLSGYVGRPRGIQDHVERLAAADRDRIGLVVEVVAGQVA